MSDIDKLQSTDVLLRTGQLNEKELSCPDCGSPMKLRSGKHSLFYGCTRWPKCNGSHGAHSTGNPNRIGKPLGKPADANTRVYRRDAHKVFDKYWRDKKMSRSAAYRWLAKRMGIVGNKNQLNLKKCHIGMFTLAQCKQVIKICEKEIK